MKTQQQLLFAYRYLLRLYPAGFRQRFAEEMLEIAESAELSEWPLIIGDTSVTIVRSWLQPGGSRSTATASGPSEYLSVGESPVKPWKLFQGLAMATILVLCACYVSTLTVWNLPYYPDDRVCGKVPIKLARMK
jgi:hypothetical protein